jgi:hypothetical protein
MSICLYFFENNSKIDWDAPNQKKCTSHKKYLYMLKNKFSYKEMKKIYKCLENPTNILGGIYMWFKNSQCKIYEMQLE